MKRSVLLPGLVALTLLACGLGRAVSSTQTPAPAVLRLALPQLRNAAYHSPDWGDFQLSDGVYHRTPPNPQESPETYQTRMLDLVLYGDLNADGFEDAVVFLSTQNGGTGHFVELAAVVDTGADAHNVSTVSLGDRVVVESGAVQAGVITLNLRVHGPNDGLCCPSQAVTQRFELKQDRLEQLP